MKKLSTILAILVLVLSAGKVLAQDIDHQVLNGATHGTTITYTTAGVELSSDNTGAAGSYPRGTDQWVTVVGTCTDTLVFSLKFTVFDIGPTDTLFVYDGPNIQSPLLIACNNTNSQMNETFYISPNNAAGAITVRLKSSSLPGTFAGFSAEFGCNYPCSSAIPHIDWTYYRTRNGQIYDTAQVKMVPASIDTTFYVDENNITHLDSIVRLDTTFVPAILHCMGDGVIFKGYGEYTHLNSYYTPSDATSTFQWAMGNKDTVSMQNGVTISYDGYVDVGCFTLDLIIFDERNCKSTAEDQLEVRVAQNPLKTIYDLNTICTTDSLYCSVGYDGDNATLTLRKIEYAQMASKTYAVKTFIPDGPQAAQQNCGPVCYTSDVTFDEFPVGRSVQSANDICSICVNFEHSFMGDYSLAIVCPTGQKSYLKYKDVPSGATSGGLPVPSAAGGGGGRLTGFPYGGDGHGTWDNTTNVCDTTYNMYGVGWNYCFSRNEDYTLVSGLPCNTTQNAQHYMSNGPVVNITHTFDPVPAHFDQSHGNAGTVNFQTLDSSDHENKSFYYMPANDFSELSGCPLNGTWQIEVCDNWGIDNGWVFSWSLDICGLASGGCDYQVGIDSVAWGPDTAGGAHYDIWNGQYRGLHVNKISSTESFVLSPDTAGVFPVAISLFDEFGCVWDTNTQITVTRTPTPYLGRDSLICGDQFIVLDAKDYYLGIDSNANYSYIWDPYGQITDTIHTIAIIGDTTRYIVEVTNFQNNVRCSARDTIDIGVSVQPIPNFDPGQYPLEGCEPFVVDVNNSTLNATRYLWDFGDGYTSTEKNPHHAYSTGTYDFKFYAYSNEGCVDSLIYPELVTVYSSPDARFTWEPAYPTVSQPYCELINRTSPDNPDYDYFWEIQYDMDYPYSYHTLTAKDTTFEWYTNGRDISGEYIVRLIARSQSLGPSGNIVNCTDTAENTVLIINDFLQFPNLVTPNGDGINDRFVIVNLVEGQAYPTNRLDIYNKWGARVFHKENISSDDDFWDPAKDNSPEGTYFFRFSAKGYNGSIERNGAIEVIR